MELHENWKSMNEGKWEYHVEGEVKALLDFLITDAGKFVIRHTEVDPSLEGKGIGRALLNKSFAYAREHGMKILPICPYAKNVMYNNRDKYGDLL